MSKKKFAHLILVILLAAAMLISCSGSGEDDQKIELVYWSMWNETEAQAMVFKEAIKDFELQNPHLSVTVQWNGREIRKTLQPALDAGTTIDIWDEDLERIVKTWQNYALKLDDYYEQTYPSTKSKKYSDTVMISLQNHLKTLSTDGTLYAAPYQPYVVAVFYNKDHFQEAGIENVPTDWNEFLEVCAKLKSAGYTPLTTDDAYVDLPLGMHLNRMFGNSSDVEALVKDRGELWDDERILSVAKDFQMLADGGYVSAQVATNKWPAGQQDVANGDVSMYFLNGTWLPNEVMGSAGEDFLWGQFAYPAVSDGVNNSMATFGAQGFQINKNSEHPDETFALAAHLTTGKWDKELSSRTYGAPMDTSLSWPLQISDSESIFDRIDGFIPWSGGLAADTDAFPVIKAAFTGLLSGRLDADGFIAEVKSNL